MGVLLEVASAPIARAKKNYYSLVQMISLLGKTKRIDGEKARNYIVFDELNMVDEVEMSTERRYRLLIIILACRK